MTAIPKPNNSTAVAVVQWRERVTDQSHRPHLGASLIGHACQRFLWLTFHWAERETFDGRMLRLFDTGKREEARVFEELRGIGCTVWSDDGGAQFRVSTHGGHFGGSMDGVVLGLPEAAKSAHVLEVKTHNAKSFAGLLADGVKKAKPQHWAQMQTYMRLADLDRALYYAVNKADDSLYLERVEHDAEASQALLDKALSIINAGEPSLKLSEDPAYFECKWCRFYELCHGQAVPEVNCRTCARATACTDGDARWHCGLGRDLTLADQRVGCPEHLFIPPLLSRIGEPFDGDETRVVYRTAEGGQFVNGPAPGFRSVEIRAANDKRILVDDYVQRIKAKYPTAEVVR